MTSQRTLPLAPRGSLICHTVVVLRDSDTCRMYARLARVPVVNILSSRRRAVTSLALLGCPGSVPPAADLTSLNEDGTRLVIGGREVHVPTGYTSSSFEATCATRAHKLRFGAHTTAHILGSTAMAKGPPRVRRLMTPVAATAVRLRSATMHKRAVKDSHSAHRGLASQGGVARIPAGCSRCGCSVG